MKTIKLLLILFAAVLVKQNVIAQSLSVQANGEVLAYDSTATLISFSGKYKSGTTYLKWTVANQHMDGSYVIYRSTDGINYEGIGYKAGVGVPISKEIAYYFCDYSPIEGIAHYKMVHVGKNKTYLCSQDIVISSDKMELVSK